MHARHILPALLCCAVLGTAAALVPSDAAEAADSGAAQAPAGRVWEESYTSPYAKAAKAAQAAPPQNNATAQNNATVDAGGRQNNATAKVDKNLHLKYGIKNNTGGANVTYDLLRF